MAQAHYQILFLEDSPVDRVLYSRFLRQDTLATYQITEAKSGLEGLTKLAESQPDLILLDLDLPDIHGSEVLAKLLANEQTNKIPVIIISANAMPMQIDKLMKSGAAGYLTKPLDVLVFLKTVKTFLKK